MLLQLVLAAGRTDDHLAVPANAAGQGVIGCCITGMQRKDYIRDGSRLEVCYRSRMGDILTDTFRATILRIQGYRTDVTQFVPIEHTAKNLMIRAVKTSPPGNPRWVELWALGYPVAVQRNPLGDNVGGPRPRPTETGPGPPRLVPRGPRAGSGSAVTGPEDGPREQRSGCSRRRLPGVLGPVLRVRPGTALKHPLEHDRYPASGITWQARRQEAPRVV